MRTEFDGQLQELHCQLQKMGGLCEKAIALAAKALTEGDAAAASGVGPLDGEIDQMERDIERLCLKLLLRQQPVAGDLRQISAALKMITDMERIGDQADDIAEIIPFLAGCAGGESVGIRRMAEAVIRMVEESVEAYVRQDVAMAQRVIQSDDAVDNCFRKMKSDLIGWIAQKPEEGEQALDLLMIAKYFERIGDHATNIAEWVVFSVTGVHKSDEMQ